MISLNDVSVTIRSDSIEKIKKIEFPEKWIEDYGKGNIKEYGFRPLKGRLGIEIATTHEVHQIFRSVIDAVAGKAFEDKKQIEYYEIRKVYKDKPHIFIKIFKLEDTENKKMKCSVCGGLFPKGQMTIKYEKNSMQFLGYYCGNCW